VAIVGSRVCDAAARDEARRLAAGLARAGVVVVSGGARGIDAAAHAGALEAGGSTVAVLAGGVLRPGPPSNRRLFARILEAGALASELPPEETPFPLHFPRRNRLVAAMSSAVVVIRAGAGSGTLHTVKAARAAGVPVLVRRGGGAGCEAILAQGGEAFDSIPEIMARLSAGGEPDHPVVAALAARGSVTAIASRTGLAPSAVVRALSELCARGLVRPCGPGEFVRA
jgi:DNA processing protein